MTQTYDVGNGLTVERLESGSVLVTVARPYEDACECFEIPDNLWASLVLTMTQFGERPNDWHAFMAHHNGTADLMQAPKKIEICKALVSRFADALA